ncbi:MAG: cobalamin B12-binding domain-containing protein, partial [Gammaproteobacteria bacterium]|nr:cobalamin B12-binding domain-containing protein [Gammaproteobacteria bacterium]
MPDIILATLNARYIHSSLGLRYLQANMGALQARTQRVEYTINQRAMDIVEDLLSHQPRIVGFGVYIWNVEQTEAVIRLLKTIRPETVVIIGGPEVSYEYDEQSIVRHADHLIVGQSDLAFSETCRQLLDNQSPDKIIHALPFELGDIQLPYAFYSDEDIAHRIIYVEASRGCPFKCEFCLSALDKTAVPFDLELFLANMQSLYDRGARHFKFVDRTFNLKIESSVRIMEFFLDKNDPDLFLHFELIPDHLPEKLK